MSNQQEKETINKETLLKYMSKKIGDLGLKSKEINAQIDILMELRDKIESNRWYGV